MSTIVAAKTAPTQRTESLLTKMRHTLRDLEINEVAKRMDLSFWAREEIERLRSKKIPRPIQRLAGKLKVSDVSVYQWMRVAAAWKTRKAFDAVYMSLKADGARITWSHIVEASTLGDVDKMEEQLTKAGKGNQSVREVRRSVASQGGRESKGGKIKAPAVMINAMASKLEATNAEVENIAACFSSSFVTPEDFHSAGELLSALEEFVPKWTKTLRPLAEKSRAALSKVASTSGKAPSLTEEPEAEEETDGEAAEDEAPEPDDDLSEAEVDGDEEDAAEDSSEEGGEGDELPEAKSVSGRSRR